MQLISEPVRYDLLLIDINMPSFSGIDLLTAIKSRKVSTPAAMISGTSDIPTIQKCLNAGAVGFIPKTASPALIVKGLGTLLRGQHFIPPHLENYVFFNFLDSSSQVGSEDLHASTTNDDETVSSDHGRKQIALKKRETEVLQLISEGKSNKEIAIILDISVSTVKFHVSNLFRKFNARSRTECVSISAQVEVLHA